MNNSCCNVEAVVSFDERGQLVIPKDLRKKFGLNPGDKFALISCVQDQGACGTGDSESTPNLCCFTLVSTSHFEGMIKQTLGPMFSEIFAKGNT